MAAICLINFTSASEINGSKLRNPETDNQPIINVVKVELAANWLINSGLIQQMKFQFIAEMNLNWIWLSRKLINAALIQRAIQSIIKRFYMFDFIISIFTYSSKLTAFIIGTIYIFLGSILIKNYCYSKSISHVILKLLLTCIIVSINVAYY